ETAFAHADAFAHPHKVRGFDPCSVSTNVAGVNRLRGETARLVKARRPQPFVETLPARTRREAGRFRGWVSAWVHRQRRRTLASIRQSLSPRHNPLPSTRR